MPPEKGSGPRSMRRPIPRARYWKRCTAPPLQALKTEAVQSTFGKQMIKAVPDASLANAQAWDKRETAHWKDLTERVKIEPPQ